ncbi:HAD-IIB family hydrolase [Shouchella shacheensis]|uniref:HAD-IIB family hydrolase n=1 Tax=Shouchella shacheensis TaxID=1649580 RepID=UPI0007400DC6|nr:HAD-IIB family hydrolase [Shouchella shacheensis]
MTAYKMLAVNIDGVLLRPQTKMSKRTKDAINYLKRKGVMVVLMTSRPYSFARKVAKALKLEGMIVAHGGAFISDTDRNELFNRSLDLETALDLCHVLERFDCEARLMYSDHSVASRPQQKQTLLAKMSLGSSGEQLVYPVSFVDSLYEQVLKEGTGPLNVTLTFESEADRRHVCETVKEEVSEIEVAGTAEENTVVVGMGAAKARALQWLAQKVKVEMNEVVAIGVAEDDLEMVEIAGLGVAMGDAWGDVRQNANWVTRSMEQEGFAYMIHEVFRKQLRTQVKYSTHE